MMGLTDKLTALDQYIWKGYKKATQYANNALGWNKFDLARKSLTGIDVSAIGFWSYDLMLGFKTDSIADLKASDIMNKTPKKIEADELAINAMLLLEKNNITQLIVTDNGSYHGFVHLHDLLKEGII